MTLHEAMAAVLREHGGWMGRDDLAREIDRRGLYRQRAGGPAPSDQLRLRARKYGDLFECSDARCTRIRLRATPSDAEAGSGAAAARVPKPPSPPRDEASAWYERLREEHRPSTLEVLLVAESPPDPGSGDRRFFYAPELSYDNLYRGVAEAVYGHEDGFDVADKPGVLRRLQADGFWLVDAVEHPINKAASSARRAAVRAGVPGLVERCRRLAPRRGVVVCHGLVYELAAPALRAAGVRLLHDEPLPFPLGNWRSQFVAGMRRALAQATPGPG
ncbi:MAG: hypothetical protein M3N16_00415 [Actinomycetota bacterium]|nr:hypothetical protein [Actinomycetota bacterium]